MYMVLLQHTNPQHSRRKEDGQRKRREVGGIQDEGKDEDLLNQSHPTGCSQLNGDIV